MRNFLKSLSAMGLIFGFFVGAGAWFQDRPGETTWLLRGGMTTLAVVSLGTFVTLELRDRARGRRNALAPDVPPCRCPEGPRAAMPGDLTGSVVVAISAARFVVNHFAIVVCDHGDAVCLHGLDSAYSEGGAFRGRSRPRAIPKDLDQLARAGRTFRARKQPCPGDAGAPAVELRPDAPLPLGKLVFLAWDGRDMECYET